LVFLLGEAVALCESLHFVGADSVDQAIEVLTDARFRPCPIRRFKEQVDGAIELLLGPLDVAEFELPLAGSEMAVGISDQRQDRVIDARLRWRPAWRRGLGAG